MNSSTIENYPELLTKELQLLTANIPPLQPQTIYMGGGSPSLLSISAFTRIAETVKQQLDLSQLKEWSVEINPASADSKLLVAMHNQGVNRISIGAQSFESRILRTIGRLHPPERTIQAMKTARSAGFTDIGIDLIAGLPGSTKDNWKKDLKTALSLTPRHISVYALSIEKNTALAKMRSSGLAIPSNEQQMESLQEGETTLTDNGFTRYEISNYARPGCECKHNLGIWRGNDYLGLGPAAASRIDSERRENIPDLDQWQEALLRNKLPPASTEKLSPEDDALERVLFRLRLSEGLPLKECLNKYPQLKYKRTEWIKTLRQLAAERITETNGVSWKLTSRGREICDYIIRQLI